VRQPSSVSPKTGTGVTIDHAIKGSPRYNANAPVRPCPWSCECERDCSTSDRSLFSCRSRDTYDLSNESRPIDAVGDESETDERGEVQEEGKILASAANDRLDRGDLDGVDGDGVGGSCCWDDCCPRRLSTERLMLTRVWVSSERAADCGRGGGRKTRGRRLEPSSLDGVRGPCA